MTSITTEIATEMSTTNYAASLENLYRASGLNVRVGASTVGVCIESGRRGDAVRAAEECARAASAMFSGVTVAAPQRDEEEDEDRRWSVFVSIRFLDGAL